MDIDLEELAAMVELLKGADFSEFRYEKGDLHILIRRGELADGNEVPHQPLKAPAVRAAAAPLAPEPARAATPQLQAAANPAAEGAAVVPAPLLGTFYGRPKPGEAAFVQVGDTVAPDTVLCIVEVMKLMNSVVAGMHGVVVAVHAKDGQLVEFGQPLFSVAPQGV